MREVVIDTETTGLNYRAGDRIIEIGCVELINHIATKKNLQFYCFVEKQINESATKVHGITNDFLEKHPSFQEQADTFLDFIKEDTLVIHNADFDIGFINNELKLVGKKALENKIIDTVKLARKTLNTRIANLDYLCRRFSIDLSERKIHGALLDSQLLAEVYLELKGGKQFSMNLGPSVKKEETINQKKHEPVAKFIKIMMTNEEIIEHKSLLKQIKSPLWEKFNYK